MAMNESGFLAAINEIEAAKGISKEVILSALEEAMIRGFRKQIGQADAPVRVKIDPEKGTIEMCQIKKVVKEVEDDFLEISVEDAKKIDKKLKEGDEYIIPASIDDLKKATALSIKSVLKQKFAEAEKGVLYEAFKDKANTIVIGKVETFDDRGCSVNIGKASVYLPHKYLIGDERFNPGDSIKVYISGVISGPHGAQIEVSRSHEGFLETLFKEEISEIYNGSIVIKKIAREAGERSKVAVYSQDPHIDPAGACIGPNGSRIQKIVAQLGNGNAKEKIDIIAYSDIVGLYLMEALKPARVVGIKVDEENKSAIAVVKDDSLSLAIGRKGVNARLAVRLTEYNIDIKTESEALEEGLEFETFESLQAQDMELKARMAMSRPVKEEVTPSVLPGLKKDYVSPLQRDYGDEDISDRDQALLEASEKEEIKKTVSVKPVSVTPVVEKEIKISTDSASKEENKEANVEIKKTVRTTTSLSDLEKSLEDDDKKKSTSSKKKFSTKKKEDEEVVKEDKSSIIPHDSSKNMSIYTEEELREIEAEDDAEEDYEEEDIDYDEYDDYYDDDNK